MKKADKSSLVFQMLGYSGITVSVPKMPLLINCTWAFATVPLLTKDTALVASNVLG